MNKKMFSFIMQYENEIDKVYRRMEEKGIHYDEAAELIGELDFLGDKLLGINWKTLNDRMDEVEPTFITEKYEDVQKYLKLYIIRDCEDDMVLCVSTAETICMVPKHLLDNPNAERLDSCRKRENGEAL